MLTALKLNLFPPVTLHPPAREAIRAFAARHKSVTHPGELEIMAGKQAIEFALVRAAEPWFDAHPHHPFIALEMAGDTRGPAVDQLELILTPVMTGPGAPRYTVTTHEACPRPITDAYHVARLLHEARLLYHEDSA